MARMYEKLDMLLPHYLLTISGVFKSVHYVVWSDRRRSTTWDGIPPVMHCGAFTWPETLSCVKYKTWNVTLLQFVHFSIVAVELMVDLQVLTCSNSILRIYIVLSWLMRNVICCHSGKKLLSLLLFKMVISSHWTHDCRCILHIVWSLLSHRLKIIKSSPYSGGIMTNMFWDNIMVVLCLIW